jgi:uncharacterized protein
MSASDKLESLKQAINKRQKLALQFSGGLDSAFLAMVAHDVLGDGVLALIADTETIPRKELAEAERLAAEIGINHRTISYSDLECKAFTSNPVDRCYHCRKARDGKLWQVAREEGFQHMADGFTLSDIHEHRPGRKAADESSIWHPLLEAALSKSEIRELARDMGLSVADKPSQACLSSRIQYHEEITREKLAMVESAEDYLRSLGAGQVRVRVHGTVARIEVLEDDVKMVMLNKNNILKRLIDLGFTYVTLDLCGYRSGSMDLMHTKEG